MSDLSADVRIVAEWIGFNYDAHLEACKRHGGSLDMPNFTARILDKLEADAGEFKITYFRGYVMTIEGEHREFRGIAPTRAEAIIRATAAWLREEEKRGE